MNIKQFKRTEANHNSTQHLGDVYHGDVYQIINSVSGKAHILRKGADLRDLDYTIVLQRDDPRAADILRAEDEGHGTSRLADLLKTDPVIENFDHRNRQTSHSVRHGGSAVEPQYFRDMRTGEVLRFKRDPKTGSLAILDGSDTRTPEIRLPKPSTRTAPATPLDPLPNPAYATSRNNFQPRQQVENSVSGRVIHAHPGNAAGHRAQKNTSVYGDNSPRTNQQRSVVNGGTAQPPWQHSDALGGRYVYNPPTDMVVLSSGATQPRPPKAPIELFANARWDGPLPSNQDDSENNNDSDE